MGTTPTRSTNATGDKSDWLEVVQQHVSSLRFGVVEIVVHDGRVIQVDVTERLRFDKGNSSKSANSPASPAATHSGDSKP